MLKLAISLPVHEQLSVVVDQCLNFDTFAPDALVMLHISPTASFNTDDLRAALADAKLERCLVNPRSVDTRWGRIINAHFCNIEALAAHCDPHTTVSFHSSNDLLLSALQDFGAPTLALYEQREVSPSSIWSTGRVCARMPALSQWMDGLGCRSAIGSQIEGSAFPFGLLAELAARVRAHPELLELFPPVAEEIIPATYALNHLGPAAGLPYVLMRPSIVNAWPSAVVPPPLRTSQPAELFGKVLRRLGSSFSSSFANPADIEAIIAGKPLKIAGWPHGMPPQPPRHYHGIKRIDRRIDDGLRVRIRAHAEAVRAQRARGLQ